MSKALLIVDVQNDFTEGGALAVSGGDAVAKRVSAHLREHAGEYTLVVGSRDWHAPEGDNGGHFAGPDFPTKHPDFVDSWPVHCVAETVGADYDPLLDTSFLSAHVFKGYGKPAYSMFEGATADGVPTAELLRSAGVSEIEVVGIATDYCVLASALDALSEGFQVTVLADMVAGVARESSHEALCTLEDAGARVIR